MEVCAKERTTTLAHERITAGLVGVADPPFLLGMRENFASLRSLLISLLGLLLLLSLPLVADGPPLQSLTPPPSVSCPISLPSLLLLFFRTLSLVLQAEGNERRLSPAFLEQARQKALYQNLEV